MTTHPQTNSPHPQQPPQSLQSYLQQSPLNLNLNSPQAQEHILGLLIDKDRMIRALEEHVTKYKAEQMRNGKLISQLQEKIVQMCPNGNNTGSSFMMASEFKDYFEDFMKNCVPACFAPLLGFPEAYVKFSRMVFNSIYSSINTQIDQKLQKITQILHLQPQPPNLSLIRSSLLKILQDNNQNLIPNQSELDLNPEPDYSLFENEQIKQIIQSEEFQQLREKLRKICVYMVLQEKKWSFFMGDEGKIQKFYKKDFVCIDGWIKEKDQVIVVLEGLVKQSQEGNFTRHPNLKNYVIPYSSEDSQEFIFVPKKQKMAVPQICTEPILQKIDKECQYSPKQIKAPLPIPELVIKSNFQTKQNDPPSNHSTVWQKQMKNEPSYSSLMNNKSKNLQQSQMTKNQSQYRSKIQTAIRKLNKVEQKYYDNLSEVDSVSLLVPFVDHNVLKQRQKNIQHNNQSHNPSLTINKSSKLKNSTKTHNLISDPSFQDILTLPQRKKDIGDQLPLKRQSSRTKKSNSRKTSAGKIVGQTIESKQNMFNRNNKQHGLKEKDEKLNKQALYKDMIKQKLGPEHKTERQRPKQSKNKHKEEDRPLRIMHIKKIREKYLNL